MASALNGDISFIEFKSEADAPDLFPEGQRIAFRTEPHFGAHALVNRTLIYRPTGTGFLVPISLEQAFGLATEIIAFQVTTLSSESAINLGITLGSLMATRSQNLDIGLSTDAVRIVDPEKRVHVIVLGNGGPHDGLQTATILVQDSEKMTDVTADLVAAVACGNAHPSALSLSRVRTSNLIFQASRLVATIAGELRYVCSDDPALIHAGSFEWRLNFAQLVVPRPVNVDDRAFRLLPQAMQFLVHEAL